MRILVVEDEGFLAEMIAVGLQRAALTADIALDGDAGRRALARTAYDVVILDRDLPGMHGDDLCRWLVESGSLTRVLMLTASGTIGDRVNGLGIGADDYLTKPFAYEELLARVLALGRRVQPALPPVLHAAGIKLDTARRYAERNGAILALTRKEFAVLEILMRARGAVVAGEELAAKVWRDKAGWDNNALRVTVSRLRAKLGDPPAVETLPAVGYRMIT